MGVVALALSLLLTIPAQAVLEAGFSRQRSYAGEFSDLTAESPFYGNVAPSMSTA